MIRTRCHPKNSRHPAPANRHAFTLLELLVVIAIIGILAALLLPVLSAVKKRGAQATCINNQKQLALGIQMYVDDNRDAFPGWASRHAGFQPPDWIYWRTNTIYPQFAQSPVLTAIPGLQQPSLRCPLDTSDTDRLSFDYGPGGDYGPYYFSYSLNGYALDSNGNNNGMSTVMTVSGGVTNVYPFYQNAVRNPSGKIMLAEEPGSLAAGDNPNGANGEPISDGRWIPASLTGGATYDALTLRHGGKADVAFADGNVQAVTPDFGADSDNTLSSY